MTKEQIIEWAFGKGWVQDKYGNLRKAWNGRSYRIAFRKKKVRYEVLQDTPDDVNANFTPGWITLSKAFYKDLSISDDGKLNGMKRKV